MKKIITLLSVPLISLFILMSCGKNNLGEESPYGEDVNNLEGVSIELNKDTYKPKGDTFELTVVNDSEEEISYGAPYTLEYYKEDTWYEVEPNNEIGFILILYTLPPGDEASEELNLESYEPLETGRYRIIRQIGDDTLTTEFEVTK